MAETTRFWVSCPHCDCTDLALLLDDLRIRCTHPECRRFVEVEELVEAENRHASEAVEIRRLLHFLRLAEDARAEPTTLPR